MLTLTIPLIPPSVNHYKMRSRQGHWYVSKEAIAFKDAVAILAGGRTVEAKSYQVSVRLYLGKGQKLDCDNAGKVLLDSLKDAGVFTSDAKVTAFHVEKHRDRENPRTEIEVVGL